MCSDVISREKKMEKDLYFFFIPQKKKRPRFFLFRKKKKKNRETQVLFLFYTIFKKKKKTPNRFRYALSRFAYVEFSQLHEYIVKRIARILYGRETEKNGGRLRLP